MLHQITWELLSLQYLVKHQQLTQTQLQYEKHHKSHFQDNHWYFQDHQWYNTATNSLQDLFDKQQPKPKSTLKLPP